MELDRKKIQRRDFPTARRGYDPDEVNAHLAEIADAVEEMRSHSPAGATAHHLILSFFSWDWLSDVPWTVWCRPHGHGPSAAADSKDADT